MKLTLKFYTDKTIFLSFDLCYNTDLIRIIVTKLIFEIREKKNVGVTKNFFLIRLEYAKNWFFFKNKFSDKVFIKETLTDIQKFLYIFQNFNFVF